MPKEVGQISRGEEHEVEKCESEVCSVSTLGTMSVGKQGEDGGR